MNPRRLPVRYTRPRPHPGPQRAAPAPGHRRPPAVRWDCGTHPTGPARLADREPAAPGRADPLGRGGPRLGGARRPARRRHRHRPDRLRRAGVDGRAVRGDRGLRRRLPDAGVQHRRAAAARRPRGAGRHPGVRLRLDGGPRADGGRAGLRDDLLDRRGLLRLGSAPAAQRRGRGRPAAALPLVAATRPAAARRPARPRPHPARLAAARRHPRARRGRRHLPGGRRAAGGHRITGLRGPAPRAHPVAQPLLRPAARPPRPPARPLRHPGAPARPAQRVDPGGRGGGRGPPAPARVRSAVARLPGRRARAGRGRRAGPHRPARRPGCPSRAAPPPARWPRRSGTPPTS
ncbi:hypothetical protein KAURM247S_02059 [Kitasatospora aureofaciens]